MGITRSRKRKNYVVHSKSSWLQKLVLWMTTTVVWMYSLVALYVFVGGAMNLNTPYLSTIKSALNITNYSIQTFLLLMLGLMVLFALLLLGWRTYNKKRFGGLRRRKYPTPTSDAEMLALELVQEEDYYTLQSQRYVVFQESPIKELKEVKARERFG